MLLMINCLFEYQRCPFKQVLIHVKINLKTSAGLTNHHDFTHSVLVADRAIDQRRKRHQDIVISKGQ